MSPTIRSKGGLPLMIGGGLVAGADECCCENPPPPVCGCPDLCIYRIEVVSPSELAIVSPLQGFCRDGVASSREVRPNVTELPEDVCHVEECQPWILEGGDPNDSPSRSFSSASSYLNAQVGESFFVTLYPLWCGCTGYIQFVIFASVECADPTGGSPEFSVYIRCSYFVYQSNRWTDGSSVSANGSRSARFQLSSSECEKIGDRTLCPVGDSRATYLSTPLTFDASWETTSLGGYDGPEPDVLDTATSQITPEFVELANNILSSFSATFRITSRPSCEITDCSCGQSLTGVSLRLNGETFTVGNEPNPDRGSEQQVWNYTDSGSNPVIEYTLWDAFFLETQYYIRAEIFCDSQQQAGGNVGPFGRDAWYVIAYNDCFEWENGTVVAQTRNTYVGAYECYEHCGKFLPSGTPPQMYLVSSVTTPGLSSCSPPAATPIIIDLADCP